MNGTAQVEAKAVAPKTKDVPVKADAGGAEVKKAAVSAQKKTANKTTK